VGRGEQGARKGDLSPYQQSPFTCDHFARRRRTEKMRDPDHTSIEPPRETIP
jgi:hypothetical protein